MIKNKEISSAELTKSVFDRIKAVEGKVDAYLTLDEENAMKKAAEIDEKLAKGEELSPLAGIPVGIKDNISTKGLRTTCASKMLGNYVPPFNATVMNKLDDIVVTGKLNMDEFAMGSSTENSHFKPTKNPFDTERIPCTCCSWYRYRRIYQTACFILRRCRSEAYIRQRFKIRSCCFRFITGSDRTSRQVRKGRCYGTVRYRWS